MTPWLDDGDVLVYAGDCIDVMQRLEARSVDVIITDPPYGIGFMGKAWDGAAITAAARPGLDHTQTRERSGSMHAGQYDLSPTANRAFQDWTRAWAVEAFRVLKPGGHLVSFCGTRTSHRMVCGIEDAGFEIRDTLAWLYGSGFPKSLDVSKAIDKAARGVPQGGSDPTSPHHGNYRTTTTEGKRTEWKGWGTALKPAHEPITLARKPLTGTVAANVLAHGTGALNIDACRIGTGDDRADGGPRPQRVATGGFNMSDAGERPTAGRWPANVILDAEAATMLDAQTGESKSTIGKRGMTKTGAEYADKGGASRFFYTAKAASSERTDGLGDDRNTHPTVKPVDLMRWLIRLLVPPGALILDPFGGSGTTGVAARRESVRCILIEREAEYLPIIAGRLSQQTLL